MNEIIEGSGFAKLAGVIQSIGYNKDIDIELATITAPFPALRIQVDNMKIELEADDLIVAESLTEHTREVELNGSLTLMKVKSALNVGDRIIVASISAGQSYVVLDKAVVIDGA